MWCIQWDFVRFGVPSGTCFWICSRTEWPKQGLEAISLRVDVPVVLAKAWMIANLYAAMFHARAKRHFGDEMPEGVAPYPTLALGRHPEQVIGGRPLGYREAVTLPPDGTTEPRKSGLFFHGSFIPMDIDNDSKVDGVACVAEWGDCP